MTVTEAVIWGALQGITEFIPISSSGHLVVVPRLFGITPPNLTFNIAVHAGTLASVLIFFRKNIIKVFTTRLKWSILGLVATAPILLFGLFFIKPIRSFFMHPEYVGWIFIVNGCILFIGHWKLVRRDCGPQDKCPPLNLWRALVIGAAQCLAVFPAISRSGTTIITGVYTGLDRRDAYRFSFMLFVPATLLALLYLAVDTASFNGISFVNLLIGGTISAVCGFLALKVLFFLLEKAKLYLFGFYCLIIGLAAIFRF